jgi:protein phosphatase
MSTRRLVAACLRGTDSELMPWSAKPQKLLRTRYAAVGAASRAALREAVSVLERAVARERFVRKEPLRRVHECLFGVLALDGEPVDPRL